jgi:hypothetical protein
MSELDSDITAAFNAVVVEHIDKLMAMGASWEDLLNHLFEAYQSTSEIALNDHVQDKENKWEDHTIAEMTSETLMTLGLWSLAAVEQSMGSTAHHPTIDVPSK